MKACEGEKEKKKEDKQDIHQKEIAVETMLRTLARTVVLAAAFTNVVSGRPAVGGHEGETASASADRAVVSVRRARGFHLGTTTAPGFDEAADAAGGVSGGGNTCNGKQDAAGCNEVKVFCSGENGKEIQVSEQQRKDCPVTCNCCNKENCDDDDVEADVADAPSTTAAPDDREQDTGEPEADQSVGGGSGEEIAVDLSSADVLLEIFNTYTFQTKTTDGEPAWKAELFTTSARTPSLFLPPPLPPPPPPCSTFPLYIKKKGGMEVVASRALSLATPHARPSPRHHNRRTLGVMWLSRNAISMLTVVLSMTSLQIRFQQRVNTPSVFEMRMQELVEEFGEEGVNQVYLKYSGLPKHTDNRIDTDTRRLDLLKLLDTNSDDMITFSELKVVVDTAEDECSAGTPNAANMVMALGLFFGFGGFFALFTLLGYLGAEDKLPECMVAVTPTALAEKIIGTGQDGAAVVRVSRLIPSHPMPRPSQHTHACYSAVASHPIAPLSEGQSCHHAVHIPCVLCLLCNGTDGNTS